MGRWAVWHRKFRQKHHDLGLTWHFSALLASIVELHRTSKEIFIWGWASLNPLVIGQGGLCTLAFMYTQLWSFGHIKFSTWVPSSVCTAKEIGNNPLLQPQALSGNLILLFNFTGNKFPSWREISSCEREENVSATHLTSEWTYYDIEVKMFHLVFQSLQIHLARVHCHSKDTGSATRTCPADCTIKQLPPCLSHFYCGNRISQRSRELRDVKHPEQGKTRHL